MAEAKYAAYEALGPFFDIIMKGLERGRCRRSLLRYYRWWCDLRVPLRIPWMAPHNPGTRRVDDGVLRIASSPRWSPAPLPARAKLLRWVQITP